MPKLKKTLQFLPLVFLFLVSQLQAQPDLSCPMTMGMSGLEINQNDHKSCPNSDHDDSSRLNAPVSDLVLELDIDPSEEELTTYNPIIQSRVAKPLSVFSHASYSHTGSKILLITQRLRI